MTERTSRLVQRRATFQFEFGLSSPPWMAYTFAKNMNPIREISLIVRNAALVTVAVILGFCVGSALGLPEWLQTFFLLPAVFLYCRLAGERRPSFWKIVGFAAVISGFVLLLHLVSKTDKSEQSGADQPLTAP